MTDKIEVEKEAYETLLMEAELSRIQMSLQQLTNRAQYLANDRSKRGATLDHNSVAKKLEEIQAKCNQET